MIRLSPVYREEPLSNVWATAPPAIVIGPVLNLVFPSSEMSQPTSSVPDDGSGTFAIVNVIASLSPWSSPMTAVPPKSAS